MRVFGYQNCSSYPHTESPSSELVLHTNYSPCTSRHAYLHILLHHYYMSLRHYCTNSVRLFTVTLPQPHTILHRIRYRDLFSYWFLHLRIEYLSTQDVFWQFPLQNFGICYFFTQSIDTAAAQLPSGSSSEALIQCERLIKAERR